MLDITFGGAAVGAGLHQNDAALFSSGSATLFFVLNVLSCNSDEGWYGGGCGLVV
jgi:hypothetical protein